MSYCSSAAWRRMDDDVLVRGLLEFVDQHGLARLQRFGDLRMDAHVRFGPVFRGSDLARFGLNFVAQRRMDLTIPEPVHYGHGWNRTRSSACLVRCG